MTARHCLAASLGAIISGISLVATLLISEKRWLAGRPLEKACPNTAPRHNYDKGSTQHLLIQSIHKSKSKWWEWTYDHCMLERATCGVLMILCSSFLGLAGFILRSWRFRGQVTLSEYQHRTTNLSGPAVLGCYLHGHCLMSRTCFFFFFNYRCLNSLHELLLQYIKITNYLNF